MTYEYECDHCGMVMTAFRTVAERHDAPKCMRCRSDTRKTYSVPRLITQRYHERDEWRHPGSRLEQLEEQRWEDRQLDADLREAEREPDWSWVRTTDDVEEEMARPI